MGRRRKSLYLVLRGRQPGIYFTWEGSEGAKAQVEGFANALYKGFYTAEEAVHWLKAHAEPPLPAPLQKWLEEQEEVLASSFSLTLEAIVEEHLQHGSTVVFTDGSALGNPGPGGYAAVILSDHTRKEISGGFRLTTNNRMELYACIAALESLASPAEVLLITDSAYVCQAITQGWLQTWEERGWRRLNGKPVENPDLWQRLYRLCQRLDVKFFWIKGHNATPENEHCDRLAKLAAQQPNLPEDSGYLLAMANGIPTSQADLSPGAVSPEDKDQAPSTCQTPSQSAEPS